jgi:hypothetical protein
MATLMIARRGASSFGVVLQAKSMDSSSVVARTRGKGVRIGVLEQARGRGAVRMIAKGGKQGALPGWGPLPEGGKRALTPTLSHAEWEREQKGERDQGTGRAPGSRLLT